MTPDPMPHIVTCRACGWSGETRQSSLKDHHKCPKCGSRNLSLAKKP